MQITGLVKKYTAGLFLVVSTMSVHAQTPGRTRPIPQSTLSLEQGTIDIDTPDFTLKLVRSSQTVAALLPKGAGGFDFTPADRLSERASNGFNHLGDINLRVRKSTANQWQQLSTSTSRKPVTPISAASPVLASADLSPTLPSDSPVQITRSWLIEGKKLVLRFAIKNVSDESVQIGALGIPMVFNNIISGRNLEQAHEICSFSDPYIGADAGYLQVTRLSGHGPTLVVVPEEKTPFEGYQLLNEPMRPNQTFEGAFAWMAHTQAYAENEWSKADPWNVPTSCTLKPGEKRSYGVRLLLAPEIRDIENTLALNKRPVAVGVPGYILPMDLNGKLFLNYSQRIASISSEPKDAIIATTGKPTKNGWQLLAIKGNHWGRARLTIVYKDGLKQTVSYYITKPATQTVADLGNFLFTKQWYVNPSDPFHRSPSVMSYDRETNKIVDQDSRVWIAGLGDEGGSGSWLAAGMKQFLQPNQVELDKYEQFVDNVLWGKIQLKEGAKKFGVRKSVFYYEPKELPDFAYDSNRNWTSWTSWNRKASEDTGRGYNYPHVAAAYWSLYRIARNSTGLVTKHPWEWYLNQAYETSKYLTDRDSNGNYHVGYVDAGLMEGDIFVAILKDIKREGWAEKANLLESNMKSRIDIWRRAKFPFGSEMAWDSTGQEEVFSWCKYLGYEDKAVVALSSILGYMPTLPHWGYNGNARRYWDFLYGGKLSRIERQLHHYGSGINAIPVLAQYREHPEDYYLLRVGYGGSMGALSNIDEEGFASAAFHSFESTLKWDAYSGDYGPNFYGHSMTTATYLINHPEFGWQSFGGNVEKHGNIVHLKPLDSMRQRVFVAPAGLWITSDAGKIDALEFNTVNHEVRIGFASANIHCKAARVTIEQLGASKNAKRYKPVLPLTVDAEAYTVPLKNSAITWITITNQ